MSAASAVRPWMVICAALLEALASAEPAAVEITGGPDASGRVYEWRIANRGPTSIIGIELPHFGATLFFAPDGWRVECTNLVNVGVNEQTGRCRAEAQSPGNGIGPGRSGVFRMQCSSREGKRGSGAVTVEFADGSKVDIGGVTLPQAESWGDRYVSLVGLGILAALFLLAKGFAGRKRARSAAVHRA